MEVAAVNKIDEMKICRLYREARHQKMQERILADMYSCDVADIREILVRRGVYNTAALRGEEQLKDVPE